jgi:hypothetical protein
MSMICFLFLLLSLLMFSSCRGFQFPNPKISKGNLDSLSDPCSTINRKKFLINFGMSFLAVTAVPSNSNALASYSSNARNFERLNSGDTSGGSVYDNNPKSAAGRKRRAITGCKSSIAREEAADSVLKVPSLSEKDCNQRVLEGDSEFMLEALLELDCPSCPYGISSSRK